jgi:hypothetical protein
MVSRLRLPLPLPSDQGNPRVIPIPEVIGDAKSAADHFRNRRYFVRPSDIDLLGDLNCIVDLDAEVADGAFDLRMSKQ